MDSKILNKIKKYNRDCTPYKEYKFDQFNIYEVSVNVDNEIYKPHYLIYIKEFDYVDDCFVSGGMYINDSKDIAYKLDDDKIYNIGLKCVDAFIKKGFCRI